MSCGVERHIVLNGMRVCYELERKKVKNIILRIKADGTVHVSAAKRVPISVIEDFLTRNADFVQNSLEKAEEARKGRPPEHKYCEGELFPLLGDWLPLKLKQGSRSSCRCDGVCFEVTVKDLTDTEKIKTTLQNFYRRECEKVIEESSRRMYPYFARKNIPWPEFKYRFMKSKWGSCRPNTGVLTFNCCLVYTPMKCIDYVVAHEFTHFLHPDHSKAFYEELSKVIPDWKERRKLLNEFVSELPK